MEESVSPLTPLTKREEEVLKCIAQGFTNQEMTEKLCITENTVKTHVHKIFEKFGLTGSRASARIKVAGWYFKNRGNNEH